jgi:GcrA cell cycle regulator
MTWTPERVDLLKTLWDKGLSASQVAKQLGGVTRNAVIGKINRMGLSGRAKPSKPKRLPAAPKPRHNNFVAINRERHQAKAFPRKVPPVVFANPGTKLSTVPKEPFQGVDRARAFEPLEGSNPRPWTEREWGECAWPVDGGADVQLSCCEPGFAKGWCKSHFRIGTVSAPAKARVDERLGISAAKKQRRWAA